MAEPDDFFCTGCSAILNLPIFLECGHALCIRCLTNRPYSAASCLDCFEFSKMKNLQSCIVMYPEGEDQCVLHRNDQKLFCVNCKVLLCGPCSLLQEHRFHDFWPIAVAAFRYRRDIESKLNTLKEKIEIIQELLDKEESSLSWAVVWDNSVHIEEGVFGNNFLSRWGEPRKEEGEELTLEKMNPKFSEVYQRLKNIETNLEPKMMEEKNEWKRMLCIQRAFVIDIITEMQEVMRKPNVQMLQNVEATLRRDVNLELLEPFLLPIEPSYLTVLAEFLKLFEKYQLFTKCNFFKLPGDKKRTIRIDRDSWGNIHPIYIFGDVTTDEVRHVLMMGKYAEGRQYKGYGTIFSKKFCIYRAQF